uniref:Uncharacterized protein n=1 Tax=Rhizophora mucronata TaxID=61149 RepID=A0A2P2JYY2_RHIMU
MATSATKLTTREFLAKLCLIIILNQPRVGLQCCCIKAIAPLCGTFNKFFSKDKKKNQSEFPFLASKSNLR